MGIKQRNTDAFYKNPLKAIISPAELHLLKAVLNEPELIVDVVKEKDKKEKKDKKEEKKKDEPPAQSPKSPA